MGPEPEPELEPDTDPLVKGTDRGIRNRTKMSRIPNTALKRYFLILKAHFSAEKIGTISVYILSIRIRCPDTELAQGI